MQGERGLVRKDRLWLARTVVAHEREHDQILPLRQRVITQAEDAASYALPVAVRHMVMLLGIGVADGERLPGCEVSRLRTGESLQAAARRHRTGQCKIL